MDCEQMGVQHKYLQRRGVEGEVGVEREGVEGRGVEGEVGRHVRTART